MSSIIRFSRTTCTFWSKPKSRGAVTWIGGPLYSHRAQVECFVGSEGAVFPERYHARPLKTPREVRNAIVYVFDERARKHGCRAQGSRPL